MTDIPPLIQLAYCDSTNDELRTKPELLCCHAAAIYTLDQRNGRGRLGRSWISPPGNLAFSISLHAANISTASLIPVVAGLVVYRVLSKFTSNLMLKWPNDILLHNRKLCGILCETLTGILPAPRIIVITGIGINLTSLPLSDIPAATLAEAGVNISGSRIAEILAEEFRNTRLSSSLPFEFVTAWNQAACLPRPFRYGSHNKTYTAITLQANGHLLVEAEGTVTELHCDEILLCL